ncbi:MAG: glycosyltransferase [Bacteroidota bacterium]|nr:glycosyltransferase [Bacteroidota bacterium]
MPKKPYKILFTIPNFDTAGSGKAMLNIALRLDKNLFEPHLCCINDSGKFFETVKNSGVPVHVYPYLLKGRPSRVKSILHAWKVSRFIKKHKFDLVHSFNYSDDYYEALACRLGGAKWIFTKKNMSWGGNGWRFRTMLAHGIAVQNNDMMQDFFKGGNNKTMLLHRGVNTGEFKKITLHENLLKKEFKLNSGTKIITTVANLVPRKGIEYLIEGFHSIKDKHINSVVFIIGDDRNEYAEKLKSIIVEKGLSERVYLIGKRMNVNELLNCSDYFILPTTNLGEGSPVALLEAMAVGLPCIASDVYGIRDQLKTLPAQMFQESDSVSLALKLDWLLNLAESELNKIVAKQSSLVNSSYTIDIEVKRHETLYCKILG